MKGLFIVLWALGSFNAFSATPDCSSQANKIIKALVQINDVGTGDGVNAELSKISRPRKGVTDATYVVTAPELSIRYKVTTRFAAGPDAACAVTSLKVQVSE